MVACIYINGRPVAIDVKLVDGTEEFIRATFADRGKVTAQVTLLAEGTVHFGHCPLHCCRHIEKFDPEATQPGPISEL